MLPGIRILAYSILRKFKISLKNQELLKKIKDEFEFSILKIFNVAKFSGFSLENIDDNN